ncbi:hypothetical protein [Bradyrhizobium sp.]|uniref:hypothetical protein n=1 Tax=Bradyrhizobium sp. TaxID=376 RepID=UPI001DCCD868|nr:hypothetical protein [Bradyrhizobium sp.]MBI5320596.1 hypothetical protein [Bradyrhizobium sp.]
MAPKRVLAAIASSALLALGSPALANEYRAGELLSLDLSKAVLSPKRIGPPAEFAPVPVQARTDPKQVAAEPQAERQPMVRTSKMTQPSVAKPRGAARTRLARRHGNPLDAQAMDTRIQTWPCKSGGICNWKR